MANDFVKAGEKNILEHEQWATHAKDYEIKLAEALANDTEVKEEANKALFKVGKALSMYYGSGHRLIAAPEKEKEEEKSKEETKTEPPKDLINAVVVLEQKTGNEAPIVEPKSEEQESTTKEQKSSETQLVPKEAPPEIKEKEEIKKKEETKEKEEVKETVEVRDEPPFFDPEPKSVEELKKLYHKLALKHHPDKGGKKEKMQTVIDEYTVLKAKLEPEKQDVPNPEQTEPEQTKSETTETTEQMKTEPEQTKSETIETAPVQDLLNKKNDTKPKAKSLVSDTPGSLEINQTLTESFTHTRDGRKKKGDLVKNAQEIDRIVNKDGSLAEKMGLMKNALHGPKSMKNIAKEMNDLDPMSRYELGLNRKAVNEDMKDDDWNIGNKDMSVSKWSPKRLTDSIAERRAANKKEQEKKKARAAGFRLSDNANDSIPRMLRMYKWLGADDDELVMFRAAMIGWSVNGKTSLYDVVKGSERAGVKGSDENSDNAIKLYQTLDPFGYSYLRNKAAVERQFPHEHVYREMMGDEDIDDDYEHEGQNALATEKETGKMKTAAGHAMGMYSTDLHSMMDEGMNKGKRVSEGIRDSEGEKFSETRKKLAQTSGMLMMESLPYIKKEKGKNVFYSTTTAKALSDYRKPGKRITVENFTKMSQDEGVADNNYKKPGGLSSLMSKPVRLQIHLDGHGGVDLKKHGVMKDGNDMLMMKATELEVVDGLTQYDYLDNEGKQKIKGFSSINTVTLREVGNPLNKYKEKDAESAFANPLLPYAPLPNVPVKETPVTETPVTETPIIQETPVTQETTETGGTPIEIKSEMTNDEDVIPDVEPKTTQENEIQIVETQEKDDRSEDHVTLYSKLERLLDEDKGDELKKPTSDYKSENYANAIMAFLQDRGENLKDLSAKSGDDIKKTILSHIKDDQNKYTVLVRLFSLKQKPKAF